LKFSIKESVVVFQSEAAIGGNPAKKATSQQVKREKEILSMLSRTHNSPKRGDLYKPTASNSLVTINRISTWEEKERREKTV